MKTATAPAKKAAAKSKAIARKAATPAPRTDVYEAVTARIVEALEGGLIPWKKGWSADFGMPRNYASGHVYQGVNAFLLSISPNGDYPLFLTYKQAQELGGQVRKGEKGQRIIAAGFSGRKKEATAEGGATVEGYSYFREFTVFNISQIDGIDFVLPAIISREFTPNEAAEKMVEGYFGRRGAPSLSHGGGRAYYTPMADAIQMPNRSTFSSEQAYYKTLLHEAAHSTGAAHRLNRADLVNSGGFGTESYGREELTAEMSAAFLSAELGYAPEAEGDQHAAYIQGWLKAIRGDKKLVVAAAAAAQKAANYITGKTPPSYEKSRQQGEGAE